jgi:hypothetical protein
MKINETFNLGRITELALKLKGSEDKEVAELAGEVLQLEAAYGQLKVKIVDFATEMIRMKHEEKLKEEDQLLEAKVEEAKKCALGDEK